MAALNLHFETYLTNPGGLDSRDQSRSRSRTSLASRLTFLKCRDFLDCRDRLSASVEIESLDRDKNKNQDKQRLYSIEIVKICRDVIFQTVEKISTVEMSFFKLSRKSRLSRPCGDKSRPPGLYLICFSFPDKSSLDHHESEAHFAKMTCQFCPSKFRFRTKLIAHSNLFHKSLVN